jgi:branched-chain amino acid transport system ATP-binding protein
MVDTAPPILEAIDISVSFGGLRALTAASVNAIPGRIHGLIGPNGAGKTTLFNVVCGLQAPTQGRVMLADHDVTKAGVHKRARLGLARTFQRLEAFNSLSARDNLLVAAELAQSARDPRKRANEILDRIGLGAVADITVGTLPTGTARLVELGRALATQPRVLLLDEASSGLTEDETDAVGALLGRVAREDQLAILLVEHDMRFVMRLCTDIFVLDFGHIIAHGSPAAVQADPAVRAAYLGAPEETPA